MKLHLIRHAKTDANSKGLLSCEIDESLNNEGFQQAENLSNYLNSIEYNTIWCSPLLRAKQTLAPFLKSHEVHPRYISSLCEGQLNLDSSAPIVTPEYLEDSGLPKTPESIGCFRGRVSELISKARNENENSTVICITHGHFIREILNMIMATTNYTRFPVGNCSDTLVEFGETQLIHYVNRTTI